MTWSPLCSLPGRSRPEGQLMNTVPLQPTPSGRTTKNLSYLAN